MAQERLNLLPVARPLPEKGFGELAVTNPEESGHLGIELAGCVRHTTRRRVERRRLIEGEDHGVDVQTGRSTSRYLEVNLA